MKDFGAIQVTTTTATRSEAERIADLLVGSRLAACVQVAGPVTSLYRWEGRIESAEEWSCVIKTSADRYREVEAAILSAHRYDVPEIVAVAVVGGNPAYLRWIETEVGAGNQVERDERY